MRSTTKFTNTITPVNALIPIKVEGSLQVEGSISGSLKSNVSNVILSGTGSETTTILSYGINVVTSSNSASFCARLPLASKGQTVTVVNTTNHRARVLPSQTGGSVNGVENGYFDVPADNQAYNFTCYENPAPGGWTSTPTPLATTIDYPVWEIDHTYGQESKFRGTYQIVASPSIGTGNDGTNLILYPNVKYWDTKAPIYAEATRLKIRTNALESDFPFQTFPSNNKMIRIFAHEAYFPVNEGTTDKEKLDLSLRVNFDFPFPPNETVQIEPDGNPTNFPAEIGDANTVWGEGSLSGNMKIGERDILSTSNYYYIFTVVIGSEMPTKRYKFKFQLETQ